MEKESTFKFNTVEEYIASQPEPVRPGLQLFRETIRNAAPEAVEVISYQMPAFKFHGILVWFAAHKNHFGFYPRSEALHMFKERLTMYEQSKGTIRFPYSQPLPVDLITDIVRHRVNENLVKESLNIEKKRKS
jgi:uncharacterized protein YdhG (YjbR/CyaY superfamily)